jgi:prepilin-type N-terminal cleavage/methylation domain-containing protein/prepilin-type processing-associated H-X9-DG protein
MRQLKAAFTLVELLVVIAIVGILVALLLPAVMEAREASRCASCKNNQHNLALAVINHETTQKHYPGYRNLQAFNKDKMARSISWVFPLLPHFEETVVFENHGPRGPLAERGNLPNVNIPTMVCPSDDLSDINAASGDRSYNSYVVNCGQIDGVGSLEMPADWRTNGIFVDRFPYDLSGNQVRHESVSAKYVSSHDGLGQTLMLSENADSGSRYDDTEALAGFVWEPTLTGGRPAPVVTKRINEGIGPTPAPTTAYSLLKPPPLLACIGCYPSGTGASVSGNIGDVAHARPSGYHRGGVVVAFADGRVQFLREDVDYLTYCLLMSPNGSQSQYAANFLQVPELFRKSLLDSASYQ